MKNPFRDKRKRETFENVVSMYFNFHPNLFTKEGNRNTGNAVGMSFWRGFDGIIPKEKWDRYSRDTTAYIEYCGGVAVKKFLEEN